MLLWSTLALFSNENISWPSICPAQAAEPVEKSESCLFCVKIVHIQNTQDKLKEQIMAVTFLKNNDITRKMKQNLKEGLSG